MESTKTHTPEELVNELKKDYNKGTKIFVEEYKRYIETIAARFLEGDSQDINVIFSDVLHCVIVKKGIFKLKNPKWLKSWLYVIIRNKVRSFRKRQLNILSKHKKYSAESESDYDFPYPDKEDVKAVLSIMACRGYSIGATLLTEHFLNDMTYDQIAATLSIKRHRIYPEIQKAKKVFVRIYNGTKA